MTIFGVILFALTILTSCSESSSNDSDKQKDESNDSDKQKDEQSGSETEEETDYGYEEDATGDCDQFIADYEAFVNSYIVIIKKMKANPSDMSIMSEYTEMVSTATTMQENVGDCMGDAKYAVKLTKLLTKMTNALAGM